MGWRISWVCVFGGGGRCLTLSQPKRLKLHQIDVRHRQKTLKSARRMNDGRRSHPCRVLRFLWLMRVFRVVETRQHAQNKELVRLVVFSLELSSLFGQSLLLLLTVCKDLIPERASMLPRFGYLLGGFGLENLLNTDKGSMTSGVFAQDFVYAGLLPLPLGSKGLLGGATR